MTPNSMRQKIFEDEGPVAGSLKLLNLESKVTINRLMLCILMIMALPMLAEAETVHAGPYTIGFEWDKEHDINLITYDMGNNSTLYQVWFNYSGTDRYIREKHSQPLVVVAMLKLPAFMNASLDKLRSHTIETYSKYGLYSTHALEGLTISDSVALRVRNISPKEEWKPQGVTVTYFFLGPVEAAKNNSTEWASKTLCSVVTQNLEPWDLEGVFKSISITEEVWGMGVGDHSFSGSKEGAGWAWPGVACHKIFPMGGRFYAWNQPAAHHPERIKALRMLQIGV